jgi:hypothetical protein
MNRVWVVARAAGLYAVRHEKKSLPPPRVFLLMALVMLAGCRFPERTAPEPVPSRIFPPGEGKVVSFHLQPRLNEPLQISSKNVQAQRQGNSLIVNFAEIEFARDPQAKSRELVLNDFTVRLYRKTPGGTLQQVAQADTGTLNNDSLTRERPQRALRAIQVRVDGVGISCNTGCVVALAANYAVPPSGGPASAESTAVEIRLDTGAVASLGAPAAVPPEPKATPQPRVRTGCAVWVTEAEASEALGQPTRYRPAGPNQCILDPAGGGGISLEFVINQDVSGFYQQTSAPLAEMLGGVGDRAVWNPGERLLTVVKDKRRLAISVQGSPESGVKGLRQKTSALARIIVERM